MPQTRRPRTTETRTNERAQPLVNRVLGNVDQRRGAATSRSSSPASSSSVRRDHPNWQRVISTLLAGALVHGGCTGVGARDGASARDAGDSGRGSTAPGHYEPPLVPIGIPDKSPVPDFPVDVILPSAELGYLAGSAGVSGSGAATYSIPLAVPPGVRGMQPRLSLQYSSGAGDGPVGLGWALVGASRITRCGKSMRTEGQADGVHFNDEDAVCLNGSKLVEIATTPEGPEYRTEASPFSRVIWKQAANVFEVWDAGGTVSTYRADTRRRNKSMEVLAGDTPYALALGPWRTRVEHDAWVDVGWNLWRVTDRFGNSMQYEYEQLTATDTPETGQGGEVRLDRIVYDPGAAVPREVRFVYADRKEHGYAVPITFFRGIRSDQSSVLERIEMWAPSVPGGGGELQWQYELGYEASSRSQAPVLVSAKQCDGDGACSWAKQFTWEGIDGTHTIVATESQAIADLEYPFQNCDRVPHKSDFGPYVLELDGDGQSDILLLQTRVPGPGNDQMWHSCAIGAPGTVPSDTTKVHWIAALSSNGYQSQIVSLTGDLTGEGYRTVVPGSVRVIDLDRDGRDELVFGTQEHRYDGSSSPRGVERKECLQIRPTPGGGLAKTECMPDEVKDKYWGQFWATADEWRVPLWNFGDFDGDGLADLLENATLRRNLGPQAGGVVAFEPTQVPEDRDDYWDIYPHETAWHWPQNNRTGLVEDVFGMGRAQFLLAAPFDLDVDYKAALPSQGGPTTIGGEPKNDAPGFVALGMSSVGPSLTMAPVPGLFGRRSLLWASTWAESIWQHRHQYNSVRADINGDGLRDIVIVRHKNEGIDAETVGFVFDKDHQGNTADEFGEYGTFVQFNTGNGFSEPVRTSMQIRPIDDYHTECAVWDFAGEPFSPESTRAWCLDVRRPPEQFLAADVDGDGLDDVVVRTRRSAPWDPAQPGLMLPSGATYADYVFPEGPQDPPGWLFFPHEGSDTSDATWWTTRVYLSTGRDFHLVEDPFDPGSFAGGTNNLLAAQLDADPQLELLVRGGPIPAEDQASISTVGADHFSQPPYLSLENYRGGRERTSSTYRRIDIQGGERERLVAVRDEGSSIAKDEFVYHDLRFPSSGDGCAYPIGCPSRLASVVDEHHSYVGHDKHGQPMYRRMKYEFWRPRSDLRGRGMLGFDETRVIDLDSGTTTISRFERNTEAAGDFFPYAGMATKVTSLVPVLTTSDDAVPAVKAGQAHVRVSTVTNELSHTPLNLVGGKHRSYFSYVASSVTTVREKQIDIEIVDGVPRVADVVAPGTLLHEATSASSYDAWGNPTVQSTAVVNGETRTTATSYMPPDPANWLNHLPEVVATTSLGVTREVRHGYTDQGHLQTIDVMHNAADPDLRSTSHRITNDRGLVVQVTTEAPGVPPRSTYLYYDADGVFVDQTKNGAGHAVTVLRHPALGVPVLTRSG